MILFELIITCIFVQLVHNQVSVSLSIGQQTQTLYSNSQINP
jgi:hypothetical protein